MLLTRTCLGQETCDSLKLKYREVYTTYEAINNQKSSMLFQSPIEIQLLNVVGEEGGFSFLFD